MIIQRKHLQIFLLTCLAAGLLSGCLDLGVVPAEAEGGISVVGSGGEGAPTNTSVSDSLVIEVGVEPTPVPTSYPYQNTTYGYELSYPETWLLTELDRGVALQKDQAQLVIQAWWANEENPPVRWYGMPAGDLLYRDKGTFLGENIPIYYLIYEERIKQVMYNEGKVISSGDLQILSYLESQESEYENINLREEVIAEAKMILESFQVSGLSAPQEKPNSVLCATDRQEPPADWRLYQNQRYDFALYHPGSLTVYETGEHTMEFQQENGLTLRLEFRRIDQQYSLPGVIPEGEVELTRFVSYFGDENPNPIMVERSGGKVTRVSVGNVFGRTTPVQFLVDIVGPTGMDIDLDQADAMLEILDTLCLTS